MKHEQLHGRRWSVAASSAVFALAGVGALAGCSATPGEEGGEVRQVISGGMADVSHHSVFLLIAQTENRIGQCTATLLAPNLLLTARHCVSPGSHDDVLCGDAALGQPYPASAFFATNDPRPREQSPFFKARDVKVPVQGGDTCGYDIALIVLDQNVPPNLAAPAVPRIDKEVMPGEPYTAVGYGVDETGDSTGVRMERTNLNIDCQPGSCGSGVESTEFRGEDGICSGDSGGPALDQDGKVVGVVSRGGPNCGTPIYGTVTAWREFLIDAGKEAATLGGYEPPFWVTTGLSDPPVVVTPVDPGAAVGEACGASQACQQGLQCYASASGEARCVEECSATSDCDSGLVCEDLGAASVCIPPQGGADDEGGCSLAGRPRGSAGWLSLGVLALGLTGLGRRFKSSRESARSRS